MSSKIKFPEVDPKSSVKSCVTETVLMSSASHPELCCTLGCDKLLGTTSCSVLVSEDLVSGFCGCIDRWQTDSNELFNIQRVAAAVCQGEGDRAGLGLESGRNSIRGEGGYVCSCQREAYHSSTVIRVGAVPVPL